MPLNFERSIVNDLEFMKPAETPICLDRDESFIGGPKECQFPDEYSRLGGIVCGAIVSKIPGCSELRSGGCAQACAENSDQTATNLGKLSPPAISF